MNEDYLDAMSVEIYENNCKVGWWDDPNRCLFECLQLVSTEIAEATEGERKNINDDHLPHLKMGDVELADALIRVLDLGGKMGLTYYKKTGPGQLNRKIVDACGIGKKHLLLNRLNIKFADHVEVNEMIKPTKLNESGWYRLNAAYSNLINGIILVSESQGYSIRHSMEAKIHYNRTREDHTREARAKEDGKKF